MAKDPIGFEGGDANLYGYVGGDPVSNFDPMGLTMWRKGNSFTDAPDGSGWQQYAPGKGVQSEPPTPTPSNPSPGNTPYWPGRIEIPTTIPKDTICYPEKTPPNDWTPRDNLCFAACMGAGAATAALWDAGFEAGGEVAEKGAAAAGKTGLKKILKMAVPGYSAFSFQKGVRQAYEICDRVCR